MSIKTFLNDVYRPVPTINQSICQSNELWHYQTLHTLTASTMTATATSTIANESNPQSYHNRRRSSHHVRPNARAMVAKWNRMVLFCSFGKHKKNKMIFGGVNKSIKVEILTQTQTHHKPKQHNRTEHAVVAFIVVGFRT